MFFFLFFVASLFFSFRSFLVRFLFIFAFLFFFGFSRIDTSLISVFLDFVAD